MNRRGHLDGVAPTNLLRTSLIIEINERGL